MLLDMATNTFIRIFWSFEVFYKVFMAEMYYYYLFMSETMDCVCFTRDLQH